MATPNCRTGRRRSSRSSRAMRSSSSTPRAGISHGHQVLQADQRGPALLHRQRLRGDHQATPERSCSSTSTRTGGRNNHGRITSRFRGGGHKQRYRIIDFRRDKIGVPAKVAAIEYDPNRTARIALLHYADGEKRYILAPDGLKVGDTIVSQPQRRHQAGQQPAAARHPPRHLDPQHRAEEGQGRAALPLRRRRRPAHGQGRRVGPGPPPQRRGSQASTSTAAPPSARSPTPITRTSSSARPGARAGSGAGRTTAASP